MKTRKILAALLAAGALGGLGSSCSHSSKGWSVEGTLPDGADFAEALVLEGYNNGRWYVVDTLSIDDYGAYSYRSAEPATYPEIMRLTGSALSHAGGSVYFPVDGTDAIRINIHGKPEGSAMAEAMWNVDSLVQATVARTGAVEAARDPELQRELARIAIADSSSIVAYYVINKSVGGRAIFDPTDRFGSRVYGAVAQNFATHRPDDPRGAMIRTVYIEGRKAAGISQPTESDSTLTVETAGLIDIVRYDSRGQRHSLAELAGKGKPVLLSFTSYQSDFSPAYSLILSELYDKYHESKGLEIYQIAFDNDEVLWKESARNLPWITVYNSPTEGIAPLTSYNVGSLPATFIIDSHGDIRSRIDDPRQLPQELPKHL